MRRGRRTCPEGILTSSPFGVGRFGLHPSLLGGLALGRVSGHYPLPFSGLGGYWHYQILFGII